MITIFDEYYNENSLRNYPFEDQASLASTTAYVMPSNLFVDAMIYPMDTDGIPFISKIDMATNVITIADSVTQESIMTGSIGISDTVVLYDIYGRQLGMLVFGAGRTGLQSGRVYEFESEATRFATSCWFAVSQVGVQGFMLADGTLMTGEVTFEGRNGIVIDSYYLSTGWFSGRNILRFSVIGAINTIDEVTKVDCLAGCVPIKAIRLITTKGSRLSASAYDTSTLAIFSSGFDLKTVCPAKNIATPTNIDPADICIPPDPPGPEPIQPDPSVVISDTTLTVPDGRLSIVTPSSPLLDYSNPVQLVCLPAGAKTIGWPIPTNPFINNRQSLTASQRFASSEPGFELGLKGY